MYPPVEPSGNGQRNLVKLITELRRRRVFRVVIAYLGAAFVLLQVADLLVEPLEAPLWTLQLTLVLLVACLPVVVLLSWFFQTSVSIERDGATNDAVDVQVSPKLATERSSAAPVMRVTVLPFRLLREDDEIAFLEIALADAIAGSLTGIRTLQVRAPLRQRERDGSAVDLDDVGTGADAVLRGTILRAGEQLRVQVHLARTADGAMLWSESSQYPLDDLIGLQDQVARRVVASLGVGLTPGERQRLQRQLPENSRAFELYLRANHASLTDFGWAEARDLYREALELDPGYAPAWARLGRCYRMLAKYDLARTDATQNLALARSALDEALRLDSDLPLAHNLYAQLEVEVGRPVDGAARLLARIRLGVNDAELFAGLVHTCRYCGLLDESIAAHRRARELDPHIPTSVAHTFFMTGQYSDALAALGPADTEYLQCLILAMLGRKEDALQIAHSWPDAERAVKRPFLASLTDLLEGRFTESATKLAAIGHMGHDAEAVYYSARHYAFMEQRDRALEALRSAVSRGFYAIDAGHHDAWFDDLRGSAEFARVRDAAQKHRRLSADTLLSAGLRPVLLLDAVPGHRSPARDR